MSEGMYKYVNKTENTEVIQNYIKIFMIYIFIHFICDYMIYQT